MDSMNAEKHTRPICSNCGLEVTSYSYSCNWCGAKLPKGEIPLFQGLIDLLKSPTKFFSNFTTYCPVFLIMFLGYYFSSFTNTVTNAISNVVISPNPRLAVTNILIGGAASSLIGAFLWVPIIVELWLVLGVKMFRRNADLKLIVLGVGYALLWPGLFSILSVPFAVISFLTLKKTVYFVSAGIKFFSSVWSLINIGIALRTLNSLNMKQVLVVFLWPVLPLALLIGYRMI